MNRSPTYPDPNNQDNNSLNNPNILNANYNTNQKYDINQHHEQEN
jgi:hypothetical protein